MILNSILSATLSLSQLGASLSSLQGYLLAKPV